MMWTMNNLYKLCIYDDAFFTPIPALPPPRPSFYQLMDMTGHNALILPVDMFSHAYSISYQHQRARYEIHIIMVSYM